MTVRRALPADVPALAELAAVTFPLACPPTTTAESVAEFVATQLSEPRFRAYLADPDRVLLVDDPGDGGPLAGYTMLVLSEPADPDVAAAVRTRPTSELSKCYVRPDRHGDGTAARLLARTVEEAQARGAVGMWLGTNVANARAVRFYEKHGFVTVGRRRFRVGTGDEHDHVLERRLAGSVP